MEQQLVTTSAYGESDYGKRLDYEQPPKYRDPIWAVLYILHVIAVLGAGVYIWVSVYPDIADDDNDTSLDFDFSPFGLIVGLLGTCVVGSLFGVFWLQVMKKFAATIIKAMLFLNIGLWVVVALIGFTFEGGISLTIIGVIMALIYALWTWCIWARIPFASALLSISSTIITRFQGTIFISLAVIAFNVGWMAVWGSAAAAYFVTSVSCTTETDYWGDSYTSCTSPNNAVVFLLLVSLYWGFQVNQNVSHTTTCGVAATWYFTTSVEHKPTPAALKRTLTTSFGSVCLGSLIVAILQAIRAMLRASKRQRNCLTLLAICLLACVERLIRYFNKYAFAQCAIYGTSFVQSAKATWNLFVTRGLTAIINDDLTGIALGCGSLIGAVVSAGAGYALGAIFYGDADDEDVRDAFPLGMAIWGFVLGFIFCRCVLQVIASAVIALFVCYAEDPASMFANRPDEYTRLVEAKPTWGDVYTTYGGAQVQQVGPVMHVAPAQPVYASQGGVPVQQTQQVVYAQPQQTQQVVYTQQGQPVQQQVVYQQVPQQQVQQQGAYPQLGQTGGYQPPPQQ